MCWESKLAMKPLRCQAFVFITTLRAFCVTLEAFVRRFRNLRYSFLAANEWKVLLSPADVATPCFECSGNSLSVE
jgi:hypothetical protein